MLRRSRSSLRITVIGAILLGGLGSAAAMALSHSTPPAPRIVLGPDHRTVLRVARFRFTDAQRGVSFRCSLNHTAFRVCASPARFGGRPGRNVFAVEARTPSGATSPPARYVWTVAPPAPGLAVSAPVANESYDARAWTASCAATGGLCGTLRLGPGHPVVSVSIRQLQTGRYWNGHSYVAPAPVWVPATLLATHGGVRAWRYGLSIPPAAGAYTVSVRSTSRRRARGHGHRRWISGRWLYATVSFAIDSPTVGAPAPAPAAPAPAAPATPPAPAGGPTTPFTIRGQVSGALYPGGAARTIPLTLANPGDASIAVTALSAALDGSVLPAGCSVEMFQISEPNLPVAGVTVPAHSAVTLPTPPEGAASIQMLDTGGNQDACQNAVLALILTGTAHA